MVSANHWLRSIETCMFLCYLSSVRANLVRATRTRWYVPKIVDSNPTLVLVFLRPCVGPILWLGLTLRWMLGSHCTLPYSALINERTLWYGQDMNIKTITRAIFLDLQAALTESEQWKASYIEGANLEMYTETLASSFKGMGFRQVAE